MSESLNHEDAVHDDVPAADDPQHPRSREDRLRHDYAQGHTQFISEEKIAQTHLSQGHPAYIAPEAEDTFELSQGHPAYLDADGDPVEPRDDAARDPE